MPAFPTAIIRALDGVAIADDITVLEGIGSEVVHETGNRIRVQLTEVDLKISKPKRIEPKGIHDHVAVAV